MHVMDAITVGRTRSRLDAAARCVAGILHDARERGVTITVVGSYARSDFRLHSDIDMLVRGETTPARRVMVERLVADHMRRSGIPYDLIFEHDIGPDDVRRLLDGEV